MYPLFTLASSLPTEGSGSLAHKGFTQPELGEDASENESDCVIYHPNQENSEKGREHVNLCWDITLGLSPDILLVTWPISGTASAEFHVHSPKGSD